MEHRIEIFNRATLWVVESGRRRVDNGQLKVDSVGKITPTVHFQLSTVSCQLLLLCTISIFFSFFSFLAE